ncbi:hypothetical protein BDR03DRAFT_975675 [Suillus americanus]|nr:hypothetical protein BDR03DRAFT_975675 [Suillus americanus]
MQHNLRPARNGSVLGYAHLEVRFGWFGHWGREWSKRKRDEIKVMVGMLLLLLLVHVRENIHHPVLIISTSIQVRPASTQNWYDTSKWETFVRVNLGTRLRDNLQGNFLSPESLCSRVPRNYAGSTNASPPLDSVSPEPIFHHPLRRRHIPNCMHSLAVTSNGSHVNSFRRHSELYIAMLFSKYCRRALQRAGRREMCAVKQGKGV